MLEKYCGTSPCVAVPAVYEGMPVVAVGEGAFYECKTLVSVTLPESVTLIGALAFQGCENLEHLHLAEGLECVGRGAFYRCEALKDVYLPDTLTEIEPEAFGHCKSLVCVRLPAGPCEMGEDLFDGCDALEYVALSEGMEVIRTAMLGGRQRLRTVTLPATLREIEPLAFSNTGLIDAIFACPDGWVVETSQYGEPAAEVPLDAAALSDPATAAQYLSSHYDVFHWRRKP